VQDTDTPPELNQNKMMTQISMDIEGVKDINEEDNEQVLDLKENIFDLGSARIRKYSSLAS
jgi:hypothetical protein